MLGIGLLGVLVIEIFTPTMLSFLGGFSSTAIFAVAATLFAISLIDLSWSLILILHFRVAAGTVEADATAEISENIRNVMMERSKLDRRLAKAFPNLEVSQKRHRKKSH